MKKILGLDLGTNSIGWALIEHDFIDKTGRINGAGSRIIPMSLDVLGKFDAGVSISQTAEKTGYRGTRVLYQRDNLRRDRLHRALNILGFLPEHYRDSIDFEKNLGQFKKGHEVKLNYKKDEQSRHQFIFLESFNEMTKDFNVSGQSIKIPYDWTLYYLRKKALTRKITNEELAWILLNFNQKRGYYQLRGEDEEDKKKRKEFCVLNVKELIDSGDEIKGKKLYNVVFDINWVYDRQIVKTEDWIGKSKEFIVTTTLENDGTPKVDKEGNIKRSFKAVNSEEDWIAIKKKTENDIEESGKTVGQYIYDTLLKNPTQKIRGKLIKTIERKYYRDELEAILQKQIELNHDLRNTEHYNSCIKELYPNNIAHRYNIKDKGFKYLFIEDIIFYQRPLKSKKSTISNCQYETRVFIKDDERQEQALKAIPKSHPLFQEFRLWQFLRNLKIYQRNAVVGGKTEIDYDVTSKLLQTESDWVELFDYLNERKEVESKNVVQYFISKKVISKTEKNNYRWNFVENKKYPCNETKTQFISRLNKVSEIADCKGFLQEVVPTGNSEKCPRLSREIQLWHIIYSVKDKIQFEKALGSFAIKNNIDELSFIENFRNFPPFKNDYGAYSEKALKNLLPLMRRGKYWNEGDISIKTTNRVSSIMERVNSISVEKELESQFESLADDDIPKQLIKSFSYLRGKNPLQGLNTYQAGYAVYNRHSEAKDISKWNTPNDIDHFLKDFKQHSLRNPIVEQVVTETLRVVRDIWEYFGGGEKDYFNEIHIELGREMKNPANIRKSISEKNIENENTNIRIKELLKELKNDAKTEGEVRPYSPSQQEILKIYEEGIFQSTDKIDDEIIKIRKTASPSNKEIEKYKLWLEQGYISPYTGIIIPLSRLFTTDYQIEHIIPQSRYFDNSFSNKIICESVINEEKSNATAYEFLKNRGGEIFHLGQGKQAKLFQLQDYEAHCNKYFRKNRMKLKKLLSEDVPEGFIERQLNDSRYISKLIKGLLSNIVREESEREATSKNIVTVTGAITSKLKQDWGLNDKWNEIITPRFKRLNEITQSNDFGYWDSKINAFRILIPDELTRGFSKKRIDHRHHALDAIVIAVTTKDHINYITSINTQRKNHALVSKLRKVEEIEKVNRKTGEIAKMQIAKAFHQPWANFTIDTKSGLESIIVSFKQNLRVINKTNNKYWSYKDENGKLRLDKEGNPKKGLIKQVKGDNWAIRKPLHAPLPYGEKEYSFSVLEISKYVGKIDFIADEDIQTKVKNILKKFKTINEAQKYLKKNPVKDSKDNEVISAVFNIPEKRYRKRQPIHKLSNRGKGGITNLKQAISFINKIADKTIRKDLLLHLETSEYDIDKAFSSGGLEVFNAKRKIPVYKLPIAEYSISKYQIGNSIHTNHKFGEAEAGTNLFFVIYWNEEKQKREYETIPLNKVIEHQKQDALLPSSERTPVPIDKTKGRFLFTLSPNDLVYVPTEEEMESSSNIDFRNLNIYQKSRIYKTVSSSGKQCFFLLSKIAKSIANKKEFSALNKMEKDIEGNMIKDRCIKLKVDRLGQIVKVGEY